MSKSKKIIKVVDIVADDDVIEANEQIVDIEDIENPVEIEPVEPTPEPVPLPLVEKVLKKAVKTSDFN